MESSSVGCIAGLVSQPLQGSTLRYLNQAGEHCGRSVAQAAVCRSAPKWNKAPSSVPTGWLASGKLCSRTIFLSSEGILNCTIVGLQRLQNHNWLPLWCEKPLCVFVSVYYQFLMRTFVHVPQRGTLRDTNRSASGWFRDVQDRTERGMVRAGGPACVRSASFREHGFASTQLIWDTFNNHPKQDASHLLRFGT